MNQESIALMKQLDTLDSRARVRLLSSVDQQRNELLAVLLQHVGGAASKDVQASAMYLIGRHRLPGGVDALMTRIDFEDAPPPVPSAEPLWERYPAMEALITLGKPSIPAALNLLATEDNDLRRRLAAKVIQYVEDAELAKFILQRATSRETDQQRQMRLADAVHLIEP